MVVPDHLVILQIPALDLLVLSTGEEVRAAAAHRHAAHRADVSRQGQLQLSTCQIPDLDRSICRSSDKPLVPRLHGDGPHPAKMTTDDPEQLPRRVPLGFRHRWSSTQEGGVSGGSAFEERHCS